MVTLSTPIAIAAVLALAPYLSVGFFPARAAGCTRKIPAWAILCPSLLCVPYLLVTLSSGTFSWSWFALYATLPVMLAAVLNRSRGQVLAGVLDFAPDWPSTCAGLSPRGRHIWLSSIKCCCSMRASTASSRFVTWMGWASISACAGAILLRSA